MVIEDNDATARLAVVTRPVGEGVTFDREQEMLRQGFRQAGQSADNDGTAVGQLEHLADLAHRTNASAAPLRCDQRHRTDAGTGMHAAVGMHALTRRSASPSPARATSATTHLLKL